MWKCINSTKYIDDPVRFGEEVFRLSQLSHRLCCGNVIETIVLSPSYFTEYINKRHVDSQIIDSCIVELNKLLDYNNKAILRLSVYKDCHMDNTPIIINVTHSNLTNAINNLLERWFDEKPYAYRKVKKLKDEETYPTVFIQPFINSEMYTVITRNSINGSLTTQEDYNSNINCRINNYDEQIQTLIAEIDNIIIIPQKIFFIYKSNDKKIIITHCETYPMKRTAYLSALVEKHKSRKITDKELLLYISPSDLTCFDGYKLSAERVYEGMGNGIGLIAGEVVFRTSDIETISNHHSDKNYIFVADEFCPKDFDTLKYCKGAIFTRSGMTSHGFVVTRGLSKPAISDDTITINENHRFFNKNGKTVKEGDKVCLSGETGMWAVNGTALPSYRKNADTGCILYIIKLLKSIKKIGLEKYPLDFQFHFSSIIRAIKTIGYEI